MPQLYIFFHTPAYFGDVVLVPIGCLALFYLALVDFSQSFLKGLSRAMASKIEVQAWVILRKDKHMKLVQIKPRQREFIAKVQFSFDGAIGQHFGTNFEIVKGQLTKVDPAKLLENVASKERREMHMWKGW